MIICLKYCCCSVDGDKDVTLGDGKQLQQYIIQAVKNDAEYLVSSISIQTILGLFELA